MLTVRTVLNGAERQNDPVSGMVSPPATLVSLLSRDMTPAPGDAVCCRTSFVGGICKLGATAGMTVKQTGTRQAAHRNG